MRLPQGIVDLVRAGVQQIFALQVDLSPAAVLCQAFGEIQIGRAAGEFAQLKIEFFLKRGVFASTPIRFGQLEKRRHQSLGHVHAAIGAEVPTRVRQADGIDFERCVYGLHS